MATLFYDSFQNNNNWIGQSLIIKEDPLGYFDNVATFASTGVLPSVFSKVINSDINSFTITFDYLGLPNNEVVAVNLGGLIGISDGGSMTDLTITYAGAIKDANPPLSPCISGKQINGWHYSDIHCGSASCSITCDTYSNRVDTTVFLSDNRVWNHYSFSFSTNSKNIRIALGDYAWANYPESGLAEDSYFTNILLTDSYGPSPFIATSAPENFRSISVDILAQVANTVSYEDSDAAINVNLGNNVTSGGYADGDVLNNIVNIIGSDYDDIILGNNEDNTLTGGDGNDILTAGTGNDILVGGNGNDKFVITTEITTAIIQDFVISDDIIDLKLFSGFNNFQAIISASQYTNGNTIINLGNSKSLILSGINYNDLQEINFSVLTLSPTAIPTITPTPVPTVSPTPVPTDPTATPTERPTSIPTVSPTHNPTNAPTKNPTLYPSPNPTAIPTSLYSTEIHIGINNPIYTGTIATENFIIDSPLSARVTGNGGIDKFTILPNEESVYTITDFDISNDRIDLSNCGVLSKDDLSLSNSAPLVITINANNQEIELLNIAPDDMSFGNLIFLTPTSPPTLDPSTPTNYQESGSENLIIGLSVGIALLGVTLIGTCCYCSVNSKISPGD